MFEGPLAALDAIDKATGEREVNAIGYCLGGTLLASTLAWMKAKGDDRIKVGDLLHDAGRLRGPGRARPVHRRGAAGRDREDHGRARLSRRRRDGRDLQHAARQRPDLVVRDQQLSAGQGSVPVRSAVLELRQYAHAGDHAQLLSAQVLPRERADRAGRRHAWAGCRSTCARSTCRSTGSRPRRTTSRPGRAPTPRTQIYIRVEKRFVLAGSGHIAGVVNPPAAGKYGYWLNDELPADPDAWFEGARHHDGSWWTDWAQWHARLAGEQVAAREPGTGELPALDDAPGSYVKLRLI